jgi:CspA family cold shock protein
LELNNVTTTIGTVKTVNDRGFFHIRPDNHTGGRDIFCHMTEIERAGLRHPEVGDRFEFEIEMTPKGAQAINIVAVL